MISIYLKSASGTIMGRAHQGDDMSMAWRESWDGGRVVLGIRARRGTKHFLDDFAGIRPRGRSAQARVRQGLELDLQALGCGWWITPTRIVGKLERAPIRRRSLWHGDARQIPAVAQGRAGINRRGAG